MTKIYNGALHMSYTLWNTPVDITSYLCMAATASRFFTWSKPNDSENRRANSWKTTENPFNNV